MSAVASFINTDIRMMMPILIAALGLVYGERSGVLNIGGEGIMLVGSFAGYAGAVLTGSVWWGLLIAGAVGGVLGILFAFMTVTLQADQTVVGAAMNILGLGVSTSLNRAVFGVNSSIPPINPFGTIHIPVLSDIPIIGTIFFSYNALVYIFVILAVVLHFIMFRTKLGLKVRAVGENPRACDTLGINVYRVRYGAVIFSTIMCGMAGAYLSTAQVSMFSENMAAGRGYIALSAVVFGRYTPLGVLIAGLVFGAGQALEVKMAAVHIGIPDQFLQMVPYLLTILALIGAVGRSSGPAAETIPYEKD